MLRITVQAGSAPWRLHLAGKLAGAWVAETEKTWRSEPVCGRRVEVDLREVTWIDESGLRLLHVMNQAGTCFIAKGVAMEALVEEITGSPRTGRGRNERPDGQALCRILTQYQKSIQTAFAEVSNADRSPKSEREPVSAASAFYGP
jgi:hypothetical protein